MNRGLLVISESPARERFFVPKLIYLAIELLGERRFASGVVHLRYGLSG